jgi:phosphatidate cytidylyltransferase
MVLIWASDIGAYIVGRLAGGPRLAPSISPGKTWSGAAGGLLAAVAVGVVAGLGPHSGGASATAGVIGGGLGLVAQLGDLLESKLKRHFGIKDSGHIIPGHGGLLDRLDAVLIAAPVAAALAWMAGPGVSLWR